MHHGCGATCFDMVRNKTNGRGTTLLTITNTHHLTPPVTPPYHHPPRLVPSESPALFALGAAAEVAAATR